MTTLDKRIAARAKDALLALALVIGLGGTARVQADEQGSARRNDVYLELGGNSVLGANYAFALSDAFSLRVGGGVVPMVGATALVMPTTHVGRNSRHGFEFGVGVQELWYADGQAHLMLSGMAGYRFRADNGFIFRFVASAFVGKPVGDDHPGVLVGVSFGRTF